MSETPIQEIARKLRVEGPYITKGFMSNQGLCNRAASRLEELESALITMLSTSQFPDRAHDWVKQAEEKAQIALLKRAEPCGMCGHGDVVRCAVCILDMDQPA